MMKVWVLKRSEMYFILFVRTTVRSTKRVCKKIQRLKAKKQVVLPGLTVCTLYRQSKNKRAVWKCRGCEGDMKASAEVSNKQNDRKEAIFGRYSDEHLCNYYPRADSCCLQRRGSK